MRAEVSRRKKIKYGKARKCKLTAMEKAIMSSQTRKIAELEEVKKNVSRETTRRKGWKLEGKQAEKTFPEGRKETMGNQIQIKMKDSEFEQPGCLFPHLLTYIVHRKFLGSHHHLRIYTSAATKFNGWRDNSTPKSRQYSNKHEYSHLF
jgi:hypothetical protein